METQTPASVPQNPIAKLAHGATYPFRGLSYIRKHNLWGIASVPVLVNVLLLAALLVTTVWFFRHYAANIDGFLIGTDTDGFWHGLRVVVSYLVWLVLIVLGLGLNGIVILLVGQAVASPFLDHLSERVEHHELNTPSIPFSAKTVLRSFVVALSDLVWSLLLLAVAHLALLLVSFIPVIGTVPAAVLAFVLDATVLAVEFVGLCQARQLVGYRARLKAVWANKFSTVGFGSVAFLLLAVPGVNLLVLPLAAVGGTLLYCDLKRADLID